MPFCPRKILMCYNMCKSSHFYTTIHLEAWCPAARTHRRPWVPWNSQSNCAAPLGTEILDSLSLSRLVGVYQPGDVRDVNVETHHHRKSPEELYPMVIRMDKTIPWTAPGLWAHLEDPAEHIRPFLERDLCSSCSAPNQTCAENTSNLVKCLCRLQQETIEIARLKSEMPEVLNIGSGDIASGFQRWQRSPQPNSYTRGRTSSSDSKAVFSFWSLICPESKQGSSKLKRCQVILFKTGEGRDVSFQALRFDHVEGI